MSRWNDNVGSYQYVLFVLNVINIFYNIVTSNNVDADNGSNSTPRLPQKNAPPRTSGPFMPRPSPSTWISFDAEIIPPLMPAFSSPDLIDDHDGNTDLCSSSVSDVVDLDEMQARARIAIPSRNTENGYGNTQSNFNVLNFNMSPYTAHIDNLGDPDFNNQVFLYQ